MTDDNPFQSVSTDTVSTDANQLDHLLAMAGDGQISAERLKIAVDDETLVIEADDDQLVMEREP